MDIDITIKNYRCFSQEHPLKLTLRRGFTSFVGTNNSGKSTILKFFYECRPLFAKLDGQFGQKRRFDTVQFEPPLDVLDPAELFFNGNGDPMHLTFTLTPPSVDGDREVPVDTFVCSLERPTTTSPQPRVVSGTIEYQSRGNTVAVDKHDNQHATNWNRFTLVREALTTIRQAIYIGPFRNAMDHSANQTYYDVQCGRDFVAAWRKLKTGTRKADKDLSLATRKAIQEVLGFDEFDIDAADDNSVFHILVNGKSYRLSELGAGLSHVIIVVANCAIKMPSYILIDEPELNLHPMMQTRFLQALGRYAAEGVLFSTHSYGLARCASDYRYVVTKPDDGRGTVVGEMGRCKSLSVTLGELTYSGYLELGVGDIVLVEGSTSVKVMIELLRRYRKAERIVVVPLGGSDMIRGGVESELQEVKRLAGEHKVFALVDSERTTTGGPPKKEVVDFEATCRTVGIECHVCERTAIDNYFSDRAVKKALGDTFQGLEAYERLKGRPNAWSKSDNWRIAQEVTKDELDATDLGAFLSRL